MANHANYGARLEFIDSILSDRFGLQKGVAKITPVAYEPDCPFSYNNFVYQVELPSGVQLRLSPKLNKSSGKLGFEPIPRDTSTFILRLTNAGTMGMCPDHRVENEVAAMHIFSTSLRSLAMREVVPSVYAWETARGSDSDTQGWMLQEFMPGVELSSVVKELSPAKLTSIRKQIASIFNALQRAGLPSTVTGSGGLSIDSSGEVITSAATFEGAGPWDSYEAYFRENLSHALASSDKKPHINGWHDNKLRGRLDAFLEKGLAGVFDTLTSCEKKVLTHGDIGSNGNILVDVASGQVTALLDFDTACVSHPSFEFLRSFYGLGGGFCEWDPHTDNGEEERALLQAKLTGSFPSPLPESRGKLDWKHAKAWEDALASLDVLRPSTMAGFRGVADVDAMIQNVVPWRLCNPQSLARQSDEQIRNIKAECEHKLEKMLSRFGY